MDHYGSFGAIRVLLDKGTPTPKWDDISSSREQARTPPYEVHIVPTATTLTTRPSHPLDHVDTEIFLICSITFYIKLCSYMVN